MKDLSDELHYAMAAVWDEIGADLLTAVEQEGRKPEIPRDEVIELVLDASRLEMHADYHPGTNLKADLKEFRKLSYEEKQRLAATVFRYEIYGW